MKKWTTKDEYKNYFARKDYKNAPTFNNIQKECSNILKNNSLYMEDILVLNYIIGREKSENSKNDRETFKQEKDV